MDLRLDFALLGELETEVLRERSPRSTLGARLGNRASVLRLEEVEEGRGRSGK